MVLYNMDNEKENRIFLTRYREEVSRRIREEGDDIHGHTV